jgi:hypothetical protein
MHTYFGKTFQKKKNLWIELYKMVLKEEKTRA